jgi:hypothetical protein
VAADYDLRPTDGLGPRIDALDADVAAAEILGRVRPESEHRIEVLVGAAATPLHGHAHGAHLGLHVAHAEAEDQATAGQYVEAGQLLREDGWVALGQDD